MKLTWRDEVTTLLALMGLVVVYAKFNSYSWTGLGSWDNAILLLAIIGLAMFAISGFNFANRSVLNIGEMVMGTVGVGVAIAGMLLASEGMFYILAAILGMLWAVDVARHARHTLMEHDLHLLRRHVHV